MSSFSNKGDTIVVDDDIINPFPFKLSDQQLNIIKETKGISKEVISIDAVAGASKTTTLVAIAHNNPKEKYLYLTFSKLLADEAKEVFPSNTESRTIHSLAYRDFGSKYAHKLSRPRGKYINVGGTGGEVAKLLKIKDIHYSEDGYISKAFIGTLILQALSRYEASDDVSISENILPKALKSSVDSVITGLSSYQTNDLFKKIKNQVLVGAKNLWKKRLDVTDKTLCTHDTYVKLWALSDPDLSAKTLLLDEVQDASMVFLGVIMRQVGKCGIILVGDPDQNIYSWRHSVNGLGIIDSKELSLSKSFRFGDSVADIAKTVLGNGKDILGFEEITSVVGYKDVVDKSKPYVKLFRMNATLIAEALDLLSDGLTLNLEIDVKDYIKLLQSSEALHLGKIKEVKHEEIVPYTSWSSFKEASETSPILGRLVKVVESNNVGRSIALLKGHRNVVNPDVIFTTSHKAKGKTFPSVILANDFPSNYDKKGKWIGITKEESRLLYVALTRAQYRLEYNKTVQEILTKTVNTLN